MQTAETERQTRQRTDAVTDCAPCKGRGFIMLELTDERGAARPGFEWCPSCGESGRLPVVQSTGGYWAVAIDHVEAFVAGEIDHDSPHVTALGPEPPPPPSYPPAGGSSPT